MEYTGPWRPAVAPRKHFANRKQRGGAAYLTVSLCLQTVASEVHIREALDLFKTSTMDAVKSGVTEMIVFTDEQRWVADEANRRSTVVGCGLITVLPPSR